jgi:hypothetical protein
MFTLKTSFNPLLLGGGDPLVEVTVNSKEETSEDVCLNYAQEFGLRLREKPSLNNYFEYFAGGYYYLLIHDS